MCPQSNIVMSWLNQMNLILFSVEKKLWNTFNLLPRNRTQMCTSQHVTNMLNKQNVVLTQQLKIIIANNCF